MEYDYSKLKGKIVECCGTQAALAQAIGISSAGLSSKLGNTTGFTQDEICRVSEVLQIPARQIAEYFFTHKVQKT